MCVVTRWREICQDGTFNWRQNVVPCRNCGPSPPCNRADYHRIADQVGHERSARVPILTTVESVTPARVVEIRPSRDVPRVTIQPANTPFYPQSTIPPPPPPPPTRPWALPISPSRDQSADSGVYIRPAQEEPKPIVTTIKPPRRVSFSEPVRERRVRASSPSPDRRRLNGEIDRLNSAIRTLRDQLQRARVLASEQHLENLNEQIASLRRRREDEIARQDALDHAREARRRRHLQADSRNPPVVHNPPPSRRRMSDTGVTSRPSSAGLTSAPRSPVHGEHWTDGNGATGPIQRISISRRQIPTSGSASSWNRVTTLEREERSVRQRAREDFEQEQLANELRPLRRRASELRGNPRPRRDPRDPIVYDDERRDAFNREI